VICGRCAHDNPEGANFCSSCGAPLHAPEETTLTLAAITAGEEADDLAGWLDGLPEGVGLLVVRHGPGEGSSFGLDADSIDIGRHPDSDIFLDDITVSRRHVDIQRDARGFELRDAGSLNGTYVNRRRVDSARLAHGDEIQIGRFRLTFVVGHGGGGA
jgi:pSer/pThr/pTyr-binding forkhead associated (FHA) protein